MLLWCFGILQSNFFYLAELLIVSMQGLDCMCMASQILLKTEVNIFRMKETVELWVAGKYAS